MDDSVVIEPDLGLRPQISMDALESAIRQILGPLAMNADKDVEEGALTTRKLIWGLEFDTEAGTCRLPPLKVERAYHVLQSGFFDAGQREVPLKEVQVLRGSQQFWLGVLPQLAPYLRSTNALLGPPNDKGQVVLRGSPQEQEDQWAAFWDAIELQRLLVGSRQFWETRFASQLEQALTTPELIALPEVQRKLVWVSADATPTRLGAIDWSGRVALACEAAPLLLPLTHPSSELEEGGSVARSEPGDDLVQIGVAELLALLVLVAARKEEWSGSVVLYLGDNTNVQDWLLKRQAGNSQANFLLKVLGALEGVHGLHVRGAYLRTYHNQTADDLTRLEPGKVMKNLGLERIEVPSDWSKVLEEAWVKRALLWLGQPEADRGVALQLAERRTGPQMPRALPALRWRVWEVGPQAQGVYERAFIAHGGTSASSEEPDPESRLCVVASVSGEAEARRVLCKAPSEAESLWIDSFRPLPLDALKSATHADAWELWGQEYDGRSFQDQVWWKRWVIAGVRKGSPGELEDFFQDRRAELEPCTPPLHTYATHWVDPKPKQGWVTGALKLDPTFPFLGPRAPKPCGTLRTQGGERALVWDPTKPLPPLHENSWEVTRADALHLLSHGEEGVQVRVVQPREVFKLLGGEGGTPLKMLSRMLSIFLLPHPRPRFPCCSVGWVGFPCV